jgi:hypothetical protein
MLVYGCGDGAEEGPEVSETGIVVDACAVGMLVGVAVTCKRSRRLVKTGQR